MLLWSFSTGYGAVAERRLKAWSRVRRGIGWLLGAQRAQLGRQDKYNGTTLERYVHYRGLLSSEQTVVVALAVARALLDRWPSQ